tara:strand:- start:475 stop:771 length:297 start_codon:yes stop_codon:yes gene_type:complete
MTNESYSKYMKNSLDMLGSKFSIREYKTSSDDLTFQRGKDLRIRILWNTSLVLEFKVDSGFWTQRNTNKADRKWMRDHANAHLNAIKQALTKARKARK